MKTLPPIRFVPYKFHWEYSSTVVKKAVEKAAEQLAVKGAQTINELMAKYAADDTNATVSLDIETTPLTKTVVHDSIELS